MGFLHWTGTMSLGIVSPFANISSSFLSLSTVRQREYPKNPKSRIGVAFNAIEAAPDRPDRDMCFGTLTRKNQTKRVILSNCLLRTKCQLFIIRPSFRPSFLPSTIIRRRTRFLTLTHDVDEDDGTNFIGVAPVFSSHDENHSG